MIRKVLRFFFKEVEHELIEEQHRASVIKMIAEEAKPDRAYWSLLILAAIIATLGLQAGNTAVIIGAMIIAPLIWPILAVSMSVVKGEAKHFGQILVLNLLSFLIAVIVSTLIAFPFVGQEFNVEILLRSSPNVTDLFIAVFSGAVAALSVSWPKISSSIAGVAVAASLMPPVSVVGIGLANGNLSLAYGAFLLFLTNVLTILMASIIVFFVLGYRPRVFLAKEALVRMRERIIGSIVIFVLFLIPFFYFIGQVYYEDNLISESRMVLRESLIAHDDATQIKTFKGTFSGDALTITAEVFVPFNKPLIVDERDVYAKQMSESLGIPVSLNLISIPTIADPDALLSPFEERLSGFLRNGTDSIEVGAPEEQ